MDNPFSPAIRYLTNHRRDTIICLLSADQLVKVSVVDREKEHFVKLDRSAYNDLDLHRIKIKYDHLSSKKEFNSLLARACQIFSDSVDAYSI